MPNDYYEDPRYAIVVTQIDVYILKSIDEINARLDNLEANLSMLCNRVQNDFIKITDGGYVQDKDFFEDGSFRDIYSNQVNYVDGHPTKAIVQTEYSNRVNAYGLSSLKDMTSDISSLKSQVYGIQCLMASRETKKIKPD
jgi:hypothetical protein